MKRTILFLIFASFLLLNSCGPSGPSGNEILRAEVIAVHDEVMPKMGQLKSLERKALEKATELQSQEVVDSVAVEKYKALAYDLNHAHEAMFEWMRQYEQLDEGRSEEELEEYLDTQMILVSEVNVEIKTALAKADDLLK